MQKTMRFSMILDDFPFRLLACSTRQPVRSEVQKQKGGAQYEYLGPTVRYRMHELSLGSICVITVCIDQFSIGIQAESGRGGREEPESWASRYSEAPTALSSRERPRGHRINIRGSGLARCAPIGGREVRRWTTGKESCP